MENTEVYDDLIIYLLLNSGVLVPGDIVEIGVFIGSGTKKLSDFMKQYIPNKKLIVIDNFDYASDNTMNLTGITSAEVLSQQIQKYEGKTQEEIFYKNIKDCKNIIVLKGDSKQLEIPVDIISFAFIDGNHNPDYIENDFNLIWKKLHSKGIIAMHDYGGDLPQVTEKINMLLEQYDKEIFRIAHYKDKSIIFITKF